MSHEKWRFKSCLEARPATTCASRAILTARLAVAGSNAAPIPSPKHSTVVHEVPGQTQVCAVREVADVIHVTLQRRWQWRAHHVEIRTDRLGVVDRVASAIHGRAIWQIPDTVDKDGLREVRAWHVAVRRDRLGMIHGVACPVHGRSIWQVPNFIAELLRGERLGGLLVVEGLAEFHGSSSTLLPIERRCLNRRLASVPKLLFPTWVNLVGILLERQERPLELFVGLRVLNDAIGQTDLSIRAGLPKLPCLLALATRCGTLLRPVLVPESASTCGQDDIGVAQVLEESRQTQGVHASRDDGRGLLHALPWLTIVRAVRLVLLEHERNVLVRRISLHLPERHRPDMDPAGSDDARNLRVHERRITTLRLWARHRAMTGAMIVQELLREVTPRHCDGSAASDITIHEEGAILCQRAELRQDVLAARDHLHRVVSCDVGGKEFRNAGLLHTCAHRFHHFRDALAHLAEYLIALRLVVLDEVATLPEGVARLAERLWLQTQFGFDDCSHHEPPIGHTAAELAPHVEDVARGAIEQAQVAR